MAEVRLEEVRKRLGGHDVLGGVTLTIGDGELFTIVGPSGCGKSTLLHLIAGLDVPTAGRILFDGDDVTPLAPRERDVALVFQSYALYPHMSVRDNLSFPLRVGPRRARSPRGTIQEEVVRVAGLLGLDHLLDRRPRDLSGGQRQRVALGRALIRRSRVLLLDEPLSNLDAQLRAGMRAELRRLHDQEKITMIYVTHDQTEALTLADRLAVLNAGQLQQVGTPREVFDRPANVFVAGFVGYPSMNLLPGRIERNEVVAGSLRLPYAAARASRLAGSVIVGFRPEALRVSASDRTGMTTGIVRLVEPAGGQTWVTLELEHPKGSAVVGRADEGFPVKPGERAALSVAEASLSLHLFDAETGMRLGREPEYPVWKARRS